MSDYYEDLLKKCGVAIAKRGLEAKVMIDATDLMILVAKAYMSRYPQLPPLPLEKIDWDKLNPPYPIESDTTTSKDIEYQIWYDGPVPIGKWDETP